MSFNPQITFVLYLHKNAKNLEECLASLVQFDPNDTEIILVHDEDSDEVNLVLENFFKTIRTNIIYIKNQEFLGQSFCYNNAIRLSSGKYIFFLSYNDVVSANLLKEIKEPMEQEYDVISIPSQKEKFYYLEQNEYTSLNKELILSCGIANLRDKIFRKDYLVQANLSFEDGRWYPDVFILNVLLSFNKWWNVLGDSLLDVSKDSETTFNLYDYLYQVDDLFNLAIRADVYEEYKKEFDYWITVICVYQFLSKIYSTYSIHFTVKKSIEKNARAIRLAMRHVTQVINKYVPNFERNVYFKKHAKEIMKYFTKSEKVCK